MKQILLVNEMDTVQFGAKLATVIRDTSTADGMVVFLRGDLGAGKTTLTRGFLQAFGHKGAVKSPTYTLIESYQYDAVALHHLDLYRLGDPEELEFMGLRDLMSRNSFFLIEWPEKGAGWLPEPELEIHLQYHGTQRQVALHYHGTNALLKQRISTITI